MIAVVLGYNNCGLSTMRPDASSFGGSSTGSICKDALLNIYAQSYHAFFMEKQCRTCHVPGGQQEAPRFGVPDLQSSYTVFSTIGTDKVKLRGTDNHGTPYTGPLNAGPLDQMAPIMVKAETDYAICIANMGGEDGPPPIQLPGGPRTDTVAKVMNADPTPKVLTFNLGNEIVSPAGKSFPGAIFSITVQTESVAGQTGYLFSKPTLQAGATALEIASIKVIINGALRPEATYTLINRKVPANQTRDVTTNGSGGGLLIAPYTPNPADTVAISIGILNATTFNPPTFAQLIAAGGIFQQNCVSCHGATNPDGGYNITTRNTAITRVAPGSPPSSVLYIRMTNPNNPMPPSGLLPAAAAKQVEDWILDGAL